MTGPSRAGLQQTLDAAGGVDNHLGYLLHAYILQEPFKHFLVSIPLALRGAWIEHYWGLCLMPICLVLTIRAARRKEPGLLIVAAPAWFMLLFDAAVAVNQVRYNLVLVPAFAVAGGRAGAACRAVARRPRHQGPGLAVRPKLKRRRRCRSATPVVPPRTHGNMRE